MRRITAADIGDPTDVASSIEEMDARSSQLSRINGSFPPHVARFQARGGTVRDIDEADDAIIDISERLRAFWRVMGTHGPEGPEHRTDSAQVSAAEQQLATVCDGLVAPLVVLTEQLTTVVAEQTEQLGRVTAERDALERRVRELEARTVDTPAPVTTRPGPVTDASQKPRQRRWWLRLFGVDE